MSTQTRHDWSGIDFVDDIERQYFAEAQLGQQVIDFLRSPTGRFLHGRAKRLAEQAQEDALKLDLDAKDALEHLRKLQRQAQYARDFMRWCAEAIENGDVAVTQLELYRS